MRPNRPRRLAVLCGISEYGSPYGDLPAVGQDLTDLGETLKSKVHKDFQFDEIRTFRDKELTATRLERILDELAQESPVDEFLLYLAGHGCVRRGIEYFVTYGAPLTNPGFRLADLASALLKVKPPKTFVVLDFCHAGALPRDVMELTQVPLQENERIAILAACRGNEVAEAGSAERIPFTRYFIDALLGARATNDGLVLWGDVGMHVSASMARSTRQRPVDYNSYLKAHPVNQLDKATGVASRDDPLDIKFVGPLRAKAREALSLSGFIVSDEIHAGRSWLIARQTIGVLTTRAVVECVYEATTHVSTERIEAFASSVRELRGSGAIDTGLLITNTGFETRSVLGHIQLATIDELYRKIFDFTPYLRALIQDFSQSPLNQVFIAPFMRRYGVTNSVRGSTNSDAEGEVVFNVTSYAAPSNAETPVEIAPYCDEWLKHPDGGRICLLGDFGSGKTSFSKWFAARQAKRCLDSPGSERIPLLIPLHRFAKAIDSKAMVTDFLANECGIGNVRMPTFQTLLDAGHFLVILDGFDEMARHVDKEVRYRTISEISHLARGKSKVVLTGRPGYFPTHEELLQVLESSSSGEDVYEAARGALEELVDYELFEICPFTEEQIKRFVEHCTATPVEASKVTKYIFNTYNLLDLTSRPVLLDMVVKSLPKLLAAKVPSRVNAAKLYDAYTGLWIDREERKGDFRKLIRKADKLRFMEELACQLFLEDKEFVPPQHLGKPIREFFRIEEGESLDYFSHDVRTCSFLRRVASSGYGFIHRSFQEFFFAKKLISDLDRQDQSLWKERDIPSEVLRFASELLFEKKERGAATLSSWIKSDLLGVLGKNCISVLCLCDGDVVIPGEASQAYGMEAHVLRDYVAFKTGKVRQASAFLSFLYRRVSAHRAVSRQYVEIFHDVFFAIITTLPGSPLMRANDIVEMVVKSMLSRVAAENARERVVRGRKQISIDELLPHQVEDILISRIDKTTPSVDESMLEFESMHDADAMWAAIEQILSRSEFYLFKVFAAGASYRDISERFGISHATARVWLWRIRNKLLNSRKLATHNLF